MKTRPGITLMELLLYMALSGVVVLSMVTFLLHMFEARTVMASQTSAQENVRLMLDRMTYAVRQGYQVETDANTLRVLSHPASNLCATVYTVFQKNGDQLMTGTGTNHDAIPLRTLSIPEVRVTDFSATRVSSAVEIEITTTDQARSATLTSTVAFRQTSSVCH